MSISVNVISRIVFSTVRSFLVTISEARQDRRGILKLPREENLSLEDLERIVRGEVAAVHAHLRRLHPNEPCVSFQKVPDAIVGLAYKDPHNPWPSMRRHPDMTGRERFGVLTFLNPLGGLTPGGHRIEGDELPFPFFANRFSGGGGCSPLTPLDFV